MSVFLYFAVQWGEGLGHSCPPPSFSPLEHYRRKSSRFILLIDKPIIYRLDTKKQQNKILFINQVFYWSIVKIGDPKKSDSEQSQSFGVPLYLVYWIREWDLRK